MNLIEKKCLCCFNNFSKPKWQSKGDFLLRKYCSKVCANKETAKVRMANPETRKKISEGLKGKEKTLTHRNNLSKALKTSPEAKKTQFKKGKDNPAFGRNQTGAANNNWKGGATNKNQKLRNDPQYKIWRQTCMERDHYQCTECGAKGYLQVHHIKTISESPELIWVVENGKTVCVSCHEKIHGRFIGKFKQKK